MKRTMAVIALSGAASLAPIAGSAPASAATTVTTDNKILPVDYSVYGCSEVIDLDGNLHTTVHVTQNDQGNHVTIVSNTQDVIGVGQTTGDVYRATSLSHTSANYTSGAADYTVTTTFNFIAPGRQEDLTAHATFHITIAPDGGIVVYDGHFHATCH